jgi:hypothetical protein
MTLLFPLVLIDKEFLSMNTKGITVENQRMKKNNMSLLQMELLMKYMRH